MGVRTDTETAMYDLPGSLWDVFESAESRVDFTTYLVRDREVLYRVKITVVWQLQGGDAAVAPTVTVVSDGEVDHLDADDRAALLARYPSFDYLP